MDTDDPVDIRWKFIGNFGVQENESRIPHVALFIISTAAVGLKPGGHYMYQKV